MPVAANNILAVEARLAAIVLAWDGLIVGASPLLSPSNFIRFTDAKRWPGRKGDVLAPADTLELRLDVPGTGRPDSRAPRTFCLQPDITVYEFVWTLTAGTRQLTTITQAHAELKAAMVMAGTQLGIPGVVARWESELRPGKSDEKYRQLVWIQRIVVKG